MASLEESQCGRLADKSMSFENSLVPAHTAATTSPPCGRTSPACAAVRALQFPPRSRANAPTAVFRRVVVKGGSEHCLAMYRRRRRVDANPRVKRASGRRACVDTWCSDTHISNMLTTRFQMMSASHLSIDCLFWVWSRRFLAVYSHDFMPRDSSTRFRFLFSPVLSPSSNAAIRVTS